MRTAARVDANQPEIVKALRTIPGCTVQPLHMVGKGCPDLLVGFMGGNYPIELKNPDMPPSKRKLTPDEKRWHRQWGGTVYTAETLDDCLMIIGVSLEAPPF